ncbi:MAG TPA: class I SAM-dependent methyltransferase [Rhizomicrobium sp.]|nr:class I SAM-dependent methyltransferase [Rhizomicrobium sp.]
MHGRALTPEWLDFLAPDDPRAIRSRRDLARINGVMRQSAILANALKGLAAPKVLADLGGGDGRFLLCLARRLARHWPGVRAVILDRQNIVTAKTQADFAALGWRCETRQGDIFQTLPQWDCDIVVANLFLHHLDDAALRALLALAAARAKAFVACEPRRSALALTAARLVGVLGANDVTRHDAVASVGAGFRGAELSVLWPQNGWMLQEYSAFPFTHVFCAHAV